MTMLRLALLFGVLQWGRLGSAWEHLPKGAPLSEKLKANDYTMVALIAPKEPRSAALEAEWQIAASKAEGKLISIDCFADKNACTEADLRWVPSIHFYKGDEFISTYPGPHRSGAILNYLSRMSRPVITDVTAKTLADFKTIDDVSFIAYLARDDEVARKEFAAVAEDFRYEFSFGVAMADVEVPSGVKTPAVVCYRPVDSESVAFTAFDKPGELTKWVEEASRPVIAELSTWNNQRLLNRGWPMVYVFAATERERAALRKRLYKLAKGNYDTLTAVTVDPLEFPLLLEELGLEQGVYPSAAVHQLSNGRIYPYPKGKALSSASIKQWGLDVYQGRIKPWTPPGLTTSYEDLEPTKTATRKISIASGLNINIDGHDEL